MPAQLRPIAIKLRDQQGQDISLNRRFLTCENGHESMLPGHNKYRVFRCPVCHLIYELTGVLLERNDAYLGPFKYGDLIEAGRWEIEEREGGPL